ncbi:Acetylornithine aminotransferase, mitochondrial [Erysiphe neolycopersici]|uniref:acetylornithine transaminase n=1 Tax=Erysiphe neolycopersici TaxID=212602 RepID=A0A420HKI0_9PEZI|nr:Acetylornithine aminotransferase, mitochondrial [Erysiphe neolycopersici]
MNSKIYSKRIVSRVCQNFTSCIRLAHVDSAVASNFAEISRHSVLLENNGTGSSTKNPHVDEQASYMVKTYLRPPPVFVRGKGCYLWDTLDKRYLDLTAGIAVNALGHCDNEISRIISDQASTFGRSHFLTHKLITCALSQLLVQTTLKSGAMQNTHSVFICNSGAEANEAAIKFARKSGKVLDPSGEKYEIISFYNSFHGRTMGALSATPNPKYQKPFSPMLPGFKYGNYNNVAEIHNLVTSKTCGVIVEPIQGEGGINVGTDEFFIALAARCREVGAVLIYDEIQCGLSRTGNFWAHASFPKSAHPDIITTAKALGNGFPIGATIVSKNVSENIIVGDHGTTFGGNPLGSRVAHHIVGRLSAPDLLQDVKDKGELFRAGFKQLQEKFPLLIQEVRGKGLILGVQLTQDPTPIIRAALDRGLLVISAGTNTLRIVPSLTITREEIIRSVQILDDVMEMVTTSPAAS